MKKKRIGAPVPIRALSKLWKIMRLSVFFLVLFVAQTFATVSYSQQTRLTFKMQGAKVIDVLNKIEDQSEFFFLFNQKLVDVERPVSIDIKNESIDKILNKLFDNTNVSYLVKDRQIILTTANPESIVSEQQKSVSGKVTDSSGSPLPGVSVVVKGTTIGVITDANGNYSLSNVPENAVLQFSFVGMKTQEIKAGTQSAINVVLAEETVGIEEVVAVGYGSQKKVNLTGSVASVGRKDIEKLSVTQTSQLLKGLASGISVKQSSGQPGKDNAIITIRGLGTFSDAGTAPLVLVDGLSSSIDLVNVNDIASISVLKDAASASIYGTRAANGVILIETKKGKDGEFKISYQANAGLQRATTLPQITDSWVYAAMYNEALTNAGGSSAYSSEEIAKYKSGIDPDNYPNKRHYYDLMHSGSGLQMDHNISFSGGTSKNTYMFSIGYLDQKGLIAETDYKRLNFLLNVNSKLKDNLTLSLKLSGMNGLSNEPTAVDKTPGLGAEGLISYALKIPNIYAGKKSNGYYGNMTGFTVEGWMDSESFIYNKTLDGTASVSIDWNISKSLKATGLVGYNFDLLKYKMFRPVLVVDQNITQGPSELTVRNTTDELLTAQAYLNYDFKIKDHAFHFLLGFSQESFKNEWIGAFRDNFPNNSLYEINAGSASNQQAFGSAYEWALRSTFGRFNYDFKEKYLVEFNTRYDGSSRFPSATRFGLFPSLSLAYRISKENYFNVPFINDLKLRGSFGKLGNQNIGNYPYQQFLTLGLNAPFGVSEYLSSGAASTVVSNTAIHWESTSVADAGFDISMFKGKLSLSADYFNKLTSGILYNITASSILGMTPSVDNAGEVSNKGIEFNIQHQNKFGDFSYNIGANFSYVENEVQELANVEKDINKGLFVGYPLGSIYGYIAEGLFIDQNDINNSPLQPKTPLPGDIKFRDISGPQGVPDGIVDPNYDRTIIGNTTPKYNFGLNINTRYKEFDFMVQLEGVAGVEGFIGGLEGNGFINGSSIQQWMVESRWTKENPNPKASYPRFLILGGQEQQFWNSTYQLLNASYLRVSNIQLGYTVPESVCQKLNLSNLRFHIGVKNLYTFDHFRKGWDPEMKIGYPPVQYFNMGLNVNF